MRLTASTSRKIRTGTPSLDEFELLKKLKRCIESQIRASLKNHGKNMLKIDDPKATWRFIRNTTFTQTKGTNPLPDIEGVNSFFSDLV